MHFCGGGVTNALSLNYYDKSCPNVEQIVSNAVKKGKANDRTVPAALLRMHFHDCFIRGCDASVLLNSTSGNKAEKDGPPNISLHAFYVIDNAKKQVEASCPGVVSCADILAFAARDAVVQSGGPNWAVPKGRKDGRTSKASESVQLPGPTFNISQLQLSFFQRGLSLNDLVALSGKLISKFQLLFYTCKLSKKKRKRVTSDASAGGHTLGFAHCSSFQNRIYNFNATRDVDPTLRPSFAASLRNTCPIKNRPRNAGATMDSSSTIFDNTYFQLILQGKSLFSSDQALVSIPQTKGLVTKFASSNQAFSDAFVKSMIKMSNLNGGQEIRKDCRVVN
ncbi:peroxidase 64 isoform X2 [Pyrus x bretschneideri]|uniref:peroxidase 64 isoform X2 n=1 Tax=Pyrus x bretschneideri TaxID=225117 RepID=UPI00203054C4|nr:peroxidase 64 isoform X2 [Pyrus x bretschneideri]